jgi:hypothetical protein
VIAADEEVLTPKSEIRVGEPERVRLFEIFFSLGLFLSLVEYFGSFLFYLLVGLLRFRRRPRRSRRVEEAFRLRQTRNELQAVRRVSCVVQPPLEADPRVTGRRGRRTLLRASVERDAQQHGGHRNGGGDKFHFPSSSSMAAMRAISMR